jgi:hypothetical protein
MSYDAVLPTNAGPLGRTRCATRSPERSERFSAPTVWEATTTGS